MQTPEERAEDDALQSCHWATSLGKRWLMGTHHGAVSKKHLQAYLDEHVFRYNRRATKGVARIAARAIEGLAISKPLTMRRLVDKNKRMPHLRLNQPEMALSEGDRHDRELCDLLAHPPPPKSLSNFEMTYPAQASPLASRNHPALRPRARGRRCPLHPHPSTARRRSFRRELADRRGAMYLSKGV